MTSTALNIQTMKKVLNIGNFYAHTKIEVHVQPQTLEMCKSEQLKQYVFWKKHGSTWSFAQSPYLWTQSKQIQLHWKPNKTRSILLKSHKVALKWPYKHAQLGEILILIPTTPSSLKMYLFIKFLPHLSPIMWWWCCAGPNLSEPIFRGLVGTAGGKGYSILYQLNVVEFWMPSHC